MAADLAWRLAGGGDEIAAAPIGGGAYELWLSIDGYTLQFRVGGAVRRILMGEPSRAKAKEAAQQDWRAICATSAPAPASLGESAQPASDSTVQRHWHLNPQRGDTLVRITPPTGGRPGYSQAGTVDRVTDETIELIVQVDIPRRMAFRRSDGFDLAGLGTFLVQV